jgi:hypothetical protein
VSLVDSFRESIGDHTAASENNPFQGVGGGVLLEGGDMRSRMPWAFIKAVFEGRSAPIGHNTRSEWQEHVSLCINECLLQASVLL